MARFRRHGFITTMAISTVLIAIVVGLMLAPHSRAAEDDDDDDNDDELDAYGHFVHKKSSSSASSSSSSSSSSSNETTEIEGDTDDQFASRTTTLAPQSPPSTSPPPSPSSAPSKPPSPSKSPAPESAPSKSPSTPPTQSPSTPPPKSQPKPTPKSEPTPSSPPSPPGNPTKKVKGKPEHKQVGTLKGSGVIEKEEYKAVGEQIPCGRVPIFERELSQSINETFDAATEDEDDYGDGAFRILFGQDATPGEWPWIVKLDLCTGGDDNNENCGSCTGSLLNSRWVITAGHCDVGKAESFEVRFGRYNLLKEEEFSMTKSFDKKIKHPKWTKLFDNDIMLFRLAEPMEMNDFVQPICLPDPAHRDSVKFSKYRKCYNLGYGTTEEGVLSDKLQKLQVEARDAKECNEAGSMALRLRKNDVCIGPRDKEHKGASCRGDSGGPNTCYDPHRNQWILFSTVSYGPSQCNREEGDEWLTVAVETVNYVDWIKETIAQNS